MQDSELAREVVSVATYIKDVLDSAWEEGCVPHGEMHAQGENDTAALRHNAGTFTTLSQLGFTPMMHSPEHEGCVPHGEIPAPGEADTAALRPNAGTFSSEHSNVSQPRLSFECVGGGLRAARGDACAGGERYGCPPN